MSMNLSSLCLPMDQIAAIHCRLRARNKRMNKAVRTQRSYIMLVELSSALLLVA